MWAVLQTEFREAAWLVGLVVSLSALGVAFAVLMANYV